MVHPRKTRCKVWPSPHAKRTVGTMKLPYGSRSGEEVPTASRRVEGFPKKPRPGVMIGIC